MEVLRLSPLSYIHVIDLNTHVERVVEGPVTFSKADNEQISFGPAPMVVIPQRHFARVSNPVVRDEKSGQVLYDEWGNVLLRHGEEEIRFAGPPFLLYPGEVLQGSPTELTVLAPDTALRLMALTDFEDKSGVKRQAGEQYLFVGPGTYWPRVEERVEELQEAIMIQKEQALRLRAKRSFGDRVAGEEWLLRKPQMYLLGVNEEQVALIDGQVLTSKTALHLQALTSFTDQFGNKRRAGEEWLVTSQQTSCYVPDVEEKVRGVVKETVLSAGHYAVVVNVVHPDTGLLQLGRRELRRGPLSFFLRPGEVLEAGVQDVHVLGDDEALLLQAREQYDDHQPGAQWMLRGPVDYVPPAQVQVLERRKAIALSKGEGVYVRDLQTGRVRAHCGSPKLLEAHEELWPKLLPAAVEELISVGSSRDQTQRRDARPREDKTRVVSYLVPYNAATQIYDFKQRVARIIFGPERVLLGPDEEFTLLSLSGGNPKRTDEIKSLCLYLGPDFMTDVITVETSDHARLSLKLAYRWRFDVDRANPERLFAVADFVGDACSAIASKVRGVVASSTFDDFHKASAQIIRAAIFEKRPTLEFPQNGLIVTGIDVQSVEPIDSRTRDALQKSVQMAIEITSRSQEAAATDKALVLAQRAQGELQRLAIQDDCSAEVLKTELLKLHSDTAIIEAIGDMASDAEARKRAAEIKGKARVAAAKLEAEARSLKTAADVAILRMEREAEVELRKKQVDLEIERARKAAHIEALTFTKLVNALGRDTILSLARAGPEQQAKLLEGLGLSTYVITDGSAPINLFGAANGLMTAGAGGE